MDVRSSLRRIPGHHHVFVADDTDIITTDEGTIDIDKTKLRTMGESRKLKQERNEITNVRKPRRLIRNSGYEIRNTKFGIRNSGYEIRNTKCINQLVNKSPSYIDIVT